MARFAVAERSAGVYADDERREFLVIDTGPDADPMEWAEIFTRRWPAEHRAETLNRQLRFGGQVVWHRSLWWSLDAGEPAPADG